MRQVVIPFHRGKIIPPETLLNILREAGIERYGLEEPKKGDGTTT